MATTNLIGLKSTGMVSYDGAGVFAGRTLTAGSSKISLSNGTGVSGNPTFDVVEASLNLNNIGGGPLTVANGGTGASSFTTNSAIFYNGTELASLGAMTNGQLIIGSTGLSPGVAAITAGTGITVTNGAGSITLSATASVPTQFDTDSGSAAPAANILTVTGANGITTSAAGSTVTVNLTNPVTVPHGGTGNVTNTANGVVYGNGTSALGVTSAGTNGQLLIAATGAAPAFATVTGTSGITFVTGANTLQISNSAIPNAALANSSLTVTAGTNMTGGGLVSLGGTVTLNVPDASTATKGAIEIATNAETLTGTATTLAVTPDDLTAKLGTQTLRGFGFGGGGSGTSLTWSAAPTDGQIPIGFSGANPSLATLTAGSGISIVNGSGSITISSSATGGLVWSEVTGTSQAMAVNHGYILNNAALVTATIPATAAIGDIIAVVGKGAGGWRIAQNGGDIIRIGSSNTTTGAGGRLDSTNQYDCIELVCITANDVWTARSVIGNLTIT